MTTTSESSDVLIVGAGITGVASAFSLAQKGMNVTVVERYHPAAMASGWTLAGVRQSGRDPAELMLAQRAVTLWQTLDEQLGAPTGYRQTGNLRLARTDAEANTIRQLVNRQRHAGLDLELLEASALNDKAPCLSPTLRCASFCASDGQADPQSTSKAYRSAAERLGVRFYSNTSVHQVTVQAGQFHSLDTSAGIMYADSCILATGIQTNELLNSQGSTIPIKWARVTVMQSDPMPAILAPVIGVANADLALRQESNGRLRMTSGAEYTDAQLTEQNRLPHVPTPVNDIEKTLARISEVLPAVANTAVSRSWGGLLDMTPDGLPVIDYVPGCEGLIVAAGFSGHGFGIGPAVGEAIAQLVAQGSTTIPLADFTFDRFAHSQSSTPELHG